MQGLSVSDAKRLGGGRARGRSPTFGKELQVCTRAHLEQKQ